MGATFLCFFHQLHVVPGCSDCRFVLYGAEVLVKSVALSCFCFGSYVWRVRINFHICGNVCVLINYYYYYYYWDLLLLRILLKRVL
jgi:hypothetical protein